MQQTEYKLDLEKRNVLRSYLRDDIVVNCVIDGTRPRNAQGIRDMEIYVLPTGQVTCFHTPHHTVM